ncbi:ABC transporter ATP-binding protein [Streptomyces sp. 8K308]|uniref:ABC transporter ATP-binding protein n=1 Tax=Streptomyces sp. 8K308 TaxID=2530388 RepID=UPI00104DCEB1|nr:ABC transporter ATP-binding protein [Streptomyces sp. 8K308]TDC08526.1 ABC transporter ATP-binding protein [Streptomyces sp. 8K308]
MSQPTATEPDAAHATEVVLRAEHIDVRYDGERPLHAVRDVSLELRRGEILGIAGESGCGKSTLAYAISRMLRPPARLIGGRVTFHGRDATETDLTALRGEELRAFRWNRLSMVFQRAMNALNPVTTIGRQFDDIFRSHCPRMAAAERRERTRELLATVGIDPDLARGYPHELSGGMRQRVVIAMALALDPEVVIMDEPTTALDVVVQREILDEIVRLRDRFGFSVIFITHDLTLLLELSDRLAVMYAGRIVEHAPTARIARGAAHPYTRGLLRSFPDLLGARRELRGIPGQPPDLREEPPGCAFADRCADAFEPCAGSRPEPHPLTPPGAAGTWTAACHLHAPHQERSVRR